MSDSIVESAKQTESIVSENETPTEVVNETDSVIDFRAHHLFSLLQLSSFGAQDPGFSQNLYRGIKETQFALTGRDEIAADHLVDTLLGAIDDDTKGVKVVSGYDEICKLCPQKMDGYCQVFGRKFTQDFLRRVDEDVINNTDGVLELGVSYTPEYIRNNMDVFRKAMHKTILNLPRIYFSYKRQSETV